jgi:hypothetical protein
MVRKKMEGDEEQRRRAALEAERAGEQPSARGRTTGASKQRTHLPHRSSLTHEERTAARHRGKQRDKEPGARSGPPPEPSRPRYPGRGRPDYTPTHEQVFRALTEAQSRHGGEGVHCEEVARTAHLPTDRTRTLLHDLATAHGLASELQRSDTPDLGPRYEVKPRM